MLKVSRNDACPCGLGKKYKQCCGLYHGGTQYPDDPERLIRSRYSAYAIGDAGYLWRTTHPANEARAGKSEAEFRRETLAYCSRVDFTGLTVHQTWPADEQGISRGKLTARYRIGNQPGAFTELSEFRHADGRLLYYKGEEIDSAE